MTSRKPNGAAGAEALEIGALFEDWTRSVTYTVKLPLRNL